MATFSVVILPAKKMANDKHKIRIMVSHNSQTRYIVTDIVIDSTSEFKNGKVIRRPDKDMLNIQIKKLCDMYFERYMKLEYADSLTCTQLIKMLSNPLTGERHRKFEDVVDEFLSQIDEEEREKTHKLYSLATKKFMQFVGIGSMMEHITPIRINQYISYLIKSKLSSTTINIYITLLKVIINYAVKMKYVHYDIDPFITAKIPSARKRETQITLEELKAIRDTNLEHYNLNVTRDIFILTYYLAGMNLVDMLAYDFRTDEINYIRKKTRNTKDGESIISFTIPEEAKPIIKKYMNKNTGKIIFGKYKNYVSCYNLLARKIKLLGKTVGIKHDFTLYSARKSFVQHGYDLGIPLSTLEYCIGQSMKEDRPIFNYVSIMKKHADKAIREILDNLK
ncbi:site-specific integrase [Bacteroides caccae]|jgi:site-specific recombinase XerD|uniref:tyrosine-type recombinase/integrase n=1 Tax=Bacteroides caccae TaxID=47678 RepID=UPI002165D57F|nr:site-specific integrase [Bacteroides caccae]MCS2366471.1 site-specific integrase [Bacteroides caccae]MCS3190908.1 site-specific integrase [Bacteroides caccae]